MLKSSALAGLTTSTDSGLSRNQSSISAAHARRRRKTAASAAVATHSSQPLLFTTNPSRLGMPATQQQQRVCSQCHLHPLAEDSRGERDRQREDGDGEEDEGRKDEQPMMSSTLSSRQTAASNGANGPNSTRRSEYKTTAESASVCIPLLAMNGRDCAPVDSPVLPHLCSACRQKQRGMWYRFRSDVTAPAMTSSSSLLPRPKSRPLSSLLLKSKSSSERRRCNKDYCPAAKVPLPLIPSKESNSLLDSRLSVHRDKLRPSKTATDQPTGANVSNSIIVTGPSPYHQSVELNVWTVTSSGQNGHGPVISQSSYRAGEMTQEPTTTRMTSFDCELPAGAEEASCHQVIDMPADDDTVVPSVMTVGGGEGGGGSSTCTPGDQASRSTSHASSCRACQLIFKRDYVFFIICSLLLAITAAPFGVPSLVYTLRWGRALRSSKEGAKVQREQRQATDCILAGLVCVSVVFVGLVALLIVLNVVCFPFVRELKKVAKVEYYNAGEDKGSSQSMEVNNNDGGQNNKTGGAQDIAGEAANFLIKQRSGAHALPDGQSSLGLSSSRQWQMFFNTRVTDGGNEPLDYAQALPAILAGTAASDRHQSELNVDEEWYPTENDDVDDLGDITALTSEYGYDELEENEDYAGYADTNTTLPAN